MKRYLIILITLLLSINAFTQAIGEWRAHLSYNDASKVVPFNNGIYTLSDGSLYSYNTEDNSIKTYNKVNSLNDIDISYIEYSQTLKTLLIVYKNANIDLLIDDNEVYNMSEFMNKSGIQDKAINDVTIDDKYAYLSTNFGIIVINMDNKEITNSYTLNKKVNSIVKINKTFYAATTEGVYKGLITDNLQNASSWNVISNDKYDKLVPFDNKIIANINYNGIYAISANFNTQNKIAGGNYSYLNISNNKLIVGNSNYIRIYKDLNNVIDISQDEGFKSIIHNKDIYWSANGNKGLNGYKYNKEKKQLEKIVSSIIPNSPKRNLQYSMNFTNNTLLVAGGGIYFDRFSNPGTISMYRNGEWNSFQEEGIADITHQPYRDITSVVQDPRDSEHHFATSAGEGVYEFKNKKFVELYTYDNSSIPTIFPGQPSGYNYMRTDGAKYDKNNNLWILGSEVKNTISILKNDNKWINLSYPEIEGKPQMEQIMFDKRNWVWLINSTWKNPVLSCINTNGTLENTKDDQTKFIIDYINQDGKSLGQLSSYCIAEDKNGAIWIGTAKGPFIINNPNKIFDTNFYLTQIKIPRNDGSNYADFLLENEQINAICIDGANRKWIGTEKSGVYLLSEDGLETIHHFTKDNSPLFSDKIRAMAINPQTGEVFMGTDKGLISYKSDAPEGEESFSNDIHAYPNPVKSDYNGLITIKGLVKDSDVKITDASGILINVGTSLGGQYTWNGKNRNGKRVASGIYFVLAADSEGKEGIVTKILMIK